MTCYPAFDQDDKYAKVKDDNHPFSKYSKALGFLSFRVADKGLADLFKNSFVVYLTFLMTGTALYHHLGGNFLKANLQQQMAVVSSIVEGLGMLLLRMKIQRQRSVTGISGKCLSMYALMYTLRQVVSFTCVPLSLEYVDQWAVEFVWLASLAIVFDVLRSVYVTYRSSYQEDLDVFNIKYLVLGCMVLAAVLHPDIHEGAMITYIWTACLYIDVLALMPQVVMMAKGGGRVAAPISHFVAATAVSRCVDLWFFVVSSEVGSTGYRFLDEFNFSGWLIVFFHILHLFLVADFMYFYLKARLSGVAMSDDLSLGTDDMC